VHYHLIFIAFSSYSRTYGNSIVFGLYFIFHLELIGECPIIKANPGCSFLVRDAIMEKNIELIHMARSIPKIKRREILGGFKETQLHNFLKELFS
jgi:hypothetical protein